MLIIGLLKTKNVESHLCENLRIWLLTVDINAYFIEPFKGHNTQLSEYSYEQTWFYEFELAVTLWNMKCQFFLNGPNPASWWFVFGLFITKNTIFKINSSEKYLSGIRQKGLNSRPLDYKTSPLTTGLWHIGLILFILEPHPHQLQVSFWRHLLKLRHIPSVKYL